MNLDLYLIAQNLSYIIYVQNIMLYRPFFFREHKKSIDYWFLRLSFGQSVAIFVSSVVWSMILVMHDYHDADSCRGTHDRARYWQITLLSLTVVGYISSCILKEDVKGRAAKIWVSLTPKIFENNDSLFHKNIV